MLDVLGMAGIAMSMIAYVPQVIHLTREHCSEGVSTRAWSMWFVGGIFVAMVAVDRGDPVFIVLQFSTCLSAALILLLGRRYRGMRCASHLPIGSREVTALAPEPASRAEAV